MSLLCMIGYCCVFLIYFTVLLAIMILYFMIMLSIIIFIAFFSVIVIVNTIIGLCSVIAIIYIFVINYQNSYFITFANVNSDCYY